MNTENNLLFWRLSKWIGAIAVAFFLIGSSSVAMAQTPALRANGLLVKHISGNSSTPSIAAGTGAGTGPTVVMVAGSTDLSGALSVTAGTTPTMGAIIATITFASSYTTAPHCVAIASGDNGANSLQLPIYTNDSTSSFNIQVPSTNVLTAGLKYTWNYQCIQ